MIKSLKMYKNYLNIYFHHTFFILKGGWKGYYGNYGLDFSLGFRHNSISILSYAVLKKKFFLNLGLKGAIEKCAGCFLVYLLLRVSFLLKGCNKQGVCGSFKNTLLLLKSLLLLLWKGIIENLGWYHRKM